MGCLVPSELKVLNNFQFEGKNPLKQMANQPREVISCVAKLI